MKLEQLAEKLAIAQTSNPWKFLLISLLITAIAGVVASGLGFDSSYEALLPAGAPEVKNADRVREKTGGTRQLVIAISGKDENKRLEFGRKLVPILEKNDNIRCVDLEFPIDFFKDRGLWLTDIKTLDELIPAIEDAIRIAKEQANPLALHLDEEEEKRELDAAWQKVDDIIGNKKDTLPFEGVLTSKDNKYTFLIVVPSIKFSDMEAGRTLLNAIKNNVEEQKPDTYGVQVRYAGALEVLQEQHIVMRSDLRNASIIAMVFGILIVAGFTRRITAPFIIGTALMAGITWTFAMARIYVGHVNIITGFLVAVLIGLGIDFGIHLFIRYQQEALQKGASIESAIINFVKGTASPALTAALTTAGVFFSFVVADFRGFSEFGLIAGTGVIFTLISSFLILPPLLLVVYRNAKSKAAKSITGALPPKVSSFFSIRLSVGIVTILLGLAAYGAYSATQIPFKNNFRHLRGVSDATAFFDYVDENIGTGFNPAVFLTQNTKDAQTVQDVLTSAMESTPSSGTSSNMGKVVSVTDLLPKNISAHKQRIDKLYDILWDPKLDKAASKDGHQSEKLNNARKMVKTTPWTIDDVPETFRRRFVTQAQKNPEYIVYAWPKEQNDADYKAAAWEDELEGISAKLKRQGISHQKADETLIVSWIYRLIKADGPPLLILAGVVVLLFLILDFRNPKKILMLLLPLSVGMLIFIGIAYLMKMELNMFNMVVVPSVIGIGIDNAVHIFHRYQDKGPGSVGFVVRHTGKAALLASLTTAVGFGSSLISHNVGLQTMGGLAVVGIASTFIAAVIFFPSVLTVLEALKKKRRVSYPPKRNNNCV